MVHMYKAYKFRMYPTRDAQAKLNSFMGTSRFIYNYYLNERINRYKNEKLSYSLWDMKKDLKLLQEKYKWLKDVDGCLLRTTLDDLDRAYSNFFKDSGFPRFKSKNHHDTYRTVCIRSSHKDNNYSNIKVDLERRVIKLPKIEEIKIRGYRNLKLFDKKIINATISKEANKYYVSVLAEEEDTNNEFSLNGAVGLDLGIKNLVVTSDGIKYEAMKKINRFEKKIKGLNRWLSRTKKESNNRRKVIAKIQRVNMKLRNIRKYYTHLITTKLVRNHDLIVAEKLQVKEMIENSKTFLKKSIANSVFSEIIRQLKYKAKWNNKKFIQIDKYYPSSQECCHCGERNKELKDLSIREWECKSCGSLNDRDINASINILYEGVKKYYREQLS